MMRLASTAEIQVLGDDVSGICLLSEMSAIAACVAYGALRPMNPAFRVATLIPVMSGLNLM
jgi:hypothetical protein